MTPLHGAATPASASAAGSMKASHEASADPRSRFFDERAATWEQRCYPPEARRRLAALVPRFGVERGDCVLDMGTGTGVLIPYLRDGVGDAGRILSFDVSFEMVRRAGCKERDAKGLCVQATAMRIPARDGAFDRVVCFAAFPHFADKPAAMREMARVVRPGGEVVIAHLLSRAELARHHGGHPAVAEDALPDDATMRGLLRDAGLVEGSITDGPGMYVARARKPRACRAGKGDLPGSPGTPGTPGGRAGGSAGGDAAESAIAGDATGNGSGVEAGFEARRVFTALKQNDAMHHSAVYGVLSGLLRAFACDAAPPHGAPGRGGALRILDVGCGEAADVVQALEGVTVGAYTGVDTSAPALAEARRHLAVLGCPVTLIEGDYCLALNTSQGSVDVLWMGLFLHHLPRALKADFLHTAHGLLASGGMVLAHDPIMGEDDTRETMLARMEAIGRERWHFLTLEEVGMVHRHWSCHGHQERFSDLCALGEAAGFDVDMVWHDADNTYGLVRFMRRG